MSTRDSQALQIPREQWLPEHLEFIQREARVVLRQRRLPFKDYLDDAVQDGCVGLLHTQKHYRNDTEASLFTYSRPFVQGAIIDALKRGRRADAKQALLAGADAGTADFAATLTVPDEAYQNPESAKLAITKAAAGAAASLCLGFLGAIRKLDPESAISARREYAKALKAIKEEFPKLPERDQRVLTLRDIENLDWNEIAHSLSASRATVQRWRQAAVSRLTEAMLRHGVAGMPLLPEETEEEEE